MCTKLESASFLGGENIQWDIQFNMTEEYKHWLAFLHAYIPVKCSDATTTFLNHLLPLFIFAPSIPATLAFFLSLAVV